MTEITSQWKGQVDERLVKLEIHRSAEDVRTAHITSRLDKIENTLVWLTRLIFGALILALLREVLQGNINVG